MKSWCASKLSSKPEQQFTLSNNSSILFLFLGNITLCHLHVWTSYTLSHETINDPFGMVTSKSSFKIGYIITDNICIIHFIIEQFSDYMHEITTIRDILTAYFWILEWMIQVDEIWNLSFGIYVTQTLTQILIQHRLKYRDTYNL